MIPTRNALPGGVQAKMEGALGANLSQVKVHTGGKSAEAASQLGARAFTIGEPSGARRGATSEAVPRRLPVSIGSDVHFGAGEFSPGTREGDRLLAHELTHTVQAQSGIQRKEEKDGEDKGREKEVGGPGVEASRSSKPQPRSKGTVMALA